MVSVVLKFLSPLYAILLAWRHLDGVHVRGLERARAASRAGPVILAANHVCWWDGQLMLVLHRALSVEGRFLVNADNVDAMSFLGKLGGIAIDRSSITATAQAMEEAVAWLSAPGRSLWMFPQGRFRPAHVRPLELERGIALLQKWSGATVIPIAIQYGFLDNHLPTVAISFGEPLTGRDQLMERLETALTTDLDSLTDWLDDPAHEGDLQPLVRSMVVPIERRPGSLFYLWTAALIGRLKRALIPDSRRP